MPIEFLARLGRLPQFAALRHRDFRLLWAATLLSSTARWADVVVVAWLTLELTDSPLMVGIVAAAKMVGYVAAPFMGVIVDRMDRRLLLLVAAGGNGAASAVMLLLFVSGWLALWHVIALALVSGLTWALDNPTRNAFVPDLVEGEHLTNAIALNSVALEITVVVGPALGGLLIPVLGIGGAYGLIAGICLVDVVVLLMMKKDVRHSVAHVHEPPMQSLIGGLGYVWGNSTVLVLMVLAFVMNLLAAPYRYAFLPVFARYVLDAGPTGYGMLTAMAGFGALAAGLWVVSLGNYERKGRLLVWASFIWPASLLLLAMSTWYSVSMALVFVAGLTQAIVWTVIATLILSHTAQPMRGRVMGLRTGVVIGLPLGNFLAGALAERFGAPIAQATYAASALLVMLAIVLLAPRLRKLD
ncbi:MAG TPA: MFS transporter [Burkholderiales bacterium]|nr:MFS transporter [Burkholderiales bacterium]